MADHTAENSGLLLSNRMYDALQKLALLGLPGLGVFYFTMAKIWNWAFGEEVTASCAAIAVLIGVVLKMSQKSFNAAVAWENNSDNPDGKYDGDLLIGITDPDQPNTFLTALNQDPEALANKDSVTFKVKNVPIAPSV